jgi:hypothetical protein
MRTVGGVDDGEILHAYRVETGEGRHVQPQRPARPAVRSSWLTRGRQLSSRSMRATLSGQRPPRSRRGGVAHMAHRHLQRKLVGVEGIDHGRVVVAHEAGPAARRSC